MAGPNTVTVRLNAEGAAELIAQLKTMGAEGEAAIRKLATAASASDGALGAMGKSIEDISNKLNKAAAALEIFGAIKLVQQVANIAESFFDFTKGASESTVAVERLGDQAGVSTSQMSGMLGALTNMGAKTDDLATVFKRLAVAISTVWPEIQKSVKDAANLIIDDQNKIKQSTLAVEQSQISLFNARQRLNSLTGVTNDPEIAKAQELKAAQLAVAEAEQRLAEAVQKRAEAAKKADEDQKNSMITVAATVKAVTDGVIDFQTASTKANLNLDNVIKGLVINAGPAVEALGQFKGSLTDLGNAAPNVQAVFFKLADFMKNSGDASLNTAVAFKLFGRGVQQDLVEAMAHGSDAIKAEIARLKELGLVLNDEFDKPAAKALEQASNKLSSVIGVLTAQVGNRFAPAFTEGMNLLTTSIEKSHGTIIAWAQDLANRVAPIVRDFFVAITGGKDFETPWVGSIVNGVKTVVTWLNDTLKPIVIDVFRLLSGEQLQTAGLTALVSTFKSIKDIAKQVSDTVGTVFSALSTAISGTGELINSAFGTNLSKADVALNVFSIAFIARFSKIAAAIFGAIELIDQLNKKFGSEGLTDDSPFKTIMENRRLLLASQLSNQKINVDEFRQQKSALEDLQKQFDDFVKSGNSQAAEGLRQTLLQPLKDIGSVQTTAAQAAEAALERAKQKGKDFAASLALSGTEGGKKLADGVNTGAGQAVAGLNTVGDAARINASAVTLVNGKLQDVGTTIRTVSVGADAWNKTGVAVRAVGTDLAGTKTKIDDADKAAAELQKNLQNLGGPAGSSAAGPGPAAAPAQNGTTTVLVQPFTDAATKIKEVLAAIVDAVTKMASDIGEALSGLTDVLVAPFKTAADQINAILDPIAKKVSDLKNNIQQINFGGLGFGGNPEGAPFASGTNAPLRGPGTSTSDSIPAFLSRDEVVLQARSVSALMKRYGSGIVRVLNNFHRMPKFSAGGMMSGLANSFSALALPPFPSNDLVPATASGGATSRATFVLGNQKFDFHAPSDVVDAFQRAAVLKGVASMGRRQGAVK